MNKIIRFLLILVIASTVLVLSTNMVSAQAQDPALHGIRFIFQSRHMMGEGIQKEFVAADFLSDYFGVDIEVLDGGKALLVDHIYYNKDIRLHKGKPYVKVSSFLNFFGVGFEKVGDYGYNVKNSSIPFFDTVLYRPQPDGSITIRNAERKIDMITVAGNKYMSMDEFLDISKAKSDTSEQNRGIIKVNGQRVDRWVNHKGKIFLNVSDTARASKLDIK